VPENHIKTSGLWEHGQKQQFEQFVGYFIKKM